MPERKPHLLHVKISWNAWRGVEYRIECPYDDLKTNRPCVVMMECNHGRPTEPESDQPEIVKWIDDEPQFVAGTDEAVAAEWKKYFEDDAQYEEDHPNGAYEPINDCWVRQYVDESDFEDGWEFEKDFEHEVAGPIPVDYRNRGAYDDSYLVLKPWEESGGE